MRCALPSWCRDGGSSRACDSCSFVKRSASLSQQSSLIWPWSAGTSLIESLGAASIGSLTWEADRGQPSQQLSRLITNSRTTRRPAKRLNRRPFHVCIKRNASVWFQVLCAHLKFILNQLNTFLETPSRWSGSAHVSSPPQTLFSNGLRRWPDLTWPSRIPIRPSIPGIFSMIARKIRSRSRNHGGISAGAGRTQLLFTYSVSGQVAERMFNVGTWNRVSPVPTWFDPELWFLFV